MRVGGMAVSMIVGLAIACAAPVAGQAGAAGGPDPQPSIEIPEELARVLRDYERHWSAGEAEALSQLFVTGGLIVRQGTWIRGREAIRTAYQNASGPLRLRAVEYGANDELGYIVGAYGYGEELPVADRGLFVLTLRRDESGRWLIVSDMDRAAN